MMIGPIAGLEFAAPSVRAIIGQNSAGCEPAGLPVSTRPKETPSAAAPKETRAPEPVSAPAPLTAERTMESPPDFNENAFRPALNWLSESDRNPPAAMTEF